MPQPYYKDHNPDPKNDPVLKDLQKRHTELETQVAHWEWVTRKAKEKFQEMQQEFQELRNDSIRNMMSLARENGIELRDNHFDVFYTLDEALAANIEDILEPFTDTVYNLKNKVEELETDIEEYIPSEDPWLGESKEDVLRHNILYTEQLLALEKMKRNK